MAGGREELMKFLSDIQVTPEIIEHPEVFTVEAMMPYLGDCEGAVSKNLFLKDKKKKLFLASVLAEKSVNLSELSKQVGASGGLRFADEAIMVEKLGVAQGCCTALALFNDKEHNVRFVLDSEFLNGAHKNVYFHPMVNTQTAGLKTEDFRKFLKATGHEPIIVNLWEMSNSGYYVMMSFAWRLLLYQPFSVYAVYRNLLFTKFH